MFIPISVSTYGRQSPWANLGLIGLCVGGFVLSGFGASESAMSSYAVWSGSPSFHQFFTHVFLHADWMHLIGNMIFLWVFGNAVNGKVNHAIFLGFFVVAGFIAAIGELYGSGLQAHMSEIVEQVENDSFASLVMGAEIEQLKSRGIPMLGASGAIMGVAGLCLVLFPLNPVRVLLIVLFRPVFFEMKAFWLILIYAGLDLLYLILYGHDGTAYTAHLAGFGVGMVFGIILLKTGLVEHDGYDVLSWFGRGGRIHPEDQGDRLRSVRTSRPTMMRPKVVRRRRRIPNRIPRQLPICSDSRYTDPGDSSPSLGIHPPRVHRGMRDDGSLGSP